MKKILFVFLWMGIVFSPASLLALPARDEKKEDLKKELGDDSELKNLLKDAEKESEKEPEKKPSGKEAPGTTFQKITQRLNQFNPRLTAFGDGTYNWTNTPVLNEDGDRISRRFSLREGELDLRADIDPYAKGVLIVAFGQERPNQYTLDIEEGYLTLETLPFNLRAKIGKFRPHIGMMNKLHAHDLPQTTYPLVVEKFVGEEGYSAQGVALTYLFPLAPIEALLSVVNSDQEGSFPYPEDPGTGLDHSDYPSLFGHIKFYGTASENFDFEVSGSYGFGYGDKKRTLKNQIFGSGFFLRWRPLKRANYTSFVLQGEFLYAERQRADTDGGNIYSFGAYILAQYQFDQNWYFGGRYDYSEDLANKQMKEYKLSGYVSYYTTEFMRFRVGYEYHQKNLNNPDVHAIIFQVTFVFGSHPTEPYWVNK